MTRKSMVEILKHTSKSIHLLKIWCEELNLSAKSNKNEIFKELIDW